MHSTCLSSECTHHGSLLCSVSLNVNLVSKSVLFWSALLVFYPEANLKPHSIPSHSSVLKALAVLILVSYIDHLGLWPGLHTQIERISAAPSSLYPFPCTQAVREWVLPHCYLCLGQGSWQGSPSVSRSPPLITLVQNGADRAEPAGRRRAFFHAVCLERSKYWKKTCP